MWTKDQFWAKCEKVLKYVVEGTKDDGIQICATFINKNNSGNSLNDSSMSSHSRACLFNKLAARKTTMAMEKNYRT